MKLSNGFSDLIGKCHTLLQFPSVAVSPISLFFDFMAISVALDLRL